MLSMGICDEFKSSQKYMLTTEHFVLEEEKKIELVKLTHENVAKVEAMIRNDSSYIKSFDKNACPIINKDKTVYAGSTAYWMTQLVNNLNKQECDITYSFNEIIQNVVRSIDRENSTRINSDGCGRNELSKRIIEFGEDKLIDSLKNRDLELFRNIEKKHSKMIKNTMEGQILLLLANFVTMLVSIYLKIQKNKTIIQFTIM